MKQQSNSVVTLALLLAASGAVVPAIAQTAVDNFTIPASVPSGTKVKIDGSSSLEGVNKGLKSKFEQQFSGTEITIPSQYAGSDSAVKSIGEGKADVATIGRTLTKAEKAQGLNSKTLGRTKIAIIVSADNPYKGSIHYKDFGKIFRGEINNWSKLPQAEGASGKIRVIDRPATSDTRRAFANYPIFKDGVKTGSNSERVDDSTKSVAEKLGKDGIGFAPADQIKDIPGIRAITINGTQPDNKAYPFSQPLVYAYKSKGGASEGAKALLGFAGDPATGGQAIASAIGSAGSVAGATAGGATGTTPEGTASPSPVAGTGTTDPNATTSPAAGTGTTDPVAGTNGTTGTGSTTTTTTTTTTDSKEGFPWLWWILGGTAAGLGAGALLRGLGGAKRGADGVAAGTTGIPTGGTTTSAVEPTTGIRPLYPPPPPRGSRGEGLSGDLSADLGISGDLRSGDLSGNLNPPSGGANITPPNLPNFSGGIDAAKGMAAAGGAALAGGAAAAAAGMFGNGEDESAPISGNLQPPQIDTPDLDLSNPLEGIKDKSANLIPDLDLGNPLEGIADKAGDLLQDSGSAIAGAGAAALAGGAAIAGGAGDAIGNIFDRGSDTDADLNIDADANASLDIPGLDLDLPDIELPNLDNPLEGVSDKAGDILKGTAAAGGAALAGGAAIAAGAGDKLAGLFGKEVPSQDLSEELSLEGLDGNPLDLDFDFGNPLDAIGAKAGEVKDAAGDLIPDLDLDFGNPLDAIGEKAGEVKDAAGNLIPDVNLDNPFGGIGDKVGEIKDAAADKAGDLLPDLDFDLNNPFGGVLDKAGEVKDAASSLIPNSLPGELPADLNNPLGGIGDKAGDILKGAAAAGGAALAGGAAMAAGAGDKIGDLFGKDDEPPTGSGLSGPQLDEFQSDDLDDPFSGLSGLLGEDSPEEGNPNNPKPNNPIAEIQDRVQDRAADFLADGKNLGAAAIAGSLGMAAGAGKAVSSFMDGQNDDREDISGSLYTEGQIVLVSPSPKQAYAHWDIPVKLKRQLRQQGGRKLAVRLYDVTDVNPQERMPESYQEFECDELAWDLQLPIDRVDRSYIAEIGYVTEDRRWLMLARSAALLIRA